MLTAYSASDGRGVYSRTPLTRRQKQLRDAADARLITLAIARALRARGRRPSSRAIVALLRGQSLSDAAFNRFLVKRWIEELPS
jgi:hypothetical protein